MAENTEAITILLQARDKELQSVINRSTRLIAKFDREARQDTDRAAKTVNSNLNKMQASFTKFGKKAVMGLGAGLIGAALVGVSKDVANVVKNIAALGDEAKRSGVNATAFQEWKFVAEQNRIGIDQMVDGLKELSLRADEFVVTGAGPALEAFERLGYTATDLGEKIKDPSALMLELIGRMGDLDKAGQIRVADEIFGGSAGERFVELIDQGSAGLQRTVDKAHEVGAVLDDEMIAKAAEIDRKFGEIQARIASTFQSMIVGGAGVLENLTAQKAELEDIVNLQDEARLFPARPISDEMRVGASPEDLDTLRAAKDGYDAIFDAVRSLSIELEMMPRQLLAQDAQDDAYLVSEIAQEADALAKSWDNATISAEDLAAEAADLIVAADEAVAALSGIDGVDMSAVSARINGLRGLVAGLAMAARDAVNAFNPQYVSSGRGNGSAEVDARRQAALDASGVPQNIPRPEARPLDPDFGMPPLVTGKGGGGGGSKGGAKAARKEDPFGDAMTAARDDVAQLELEAAELLAVAAAGLEYADAVELARKRAELLFEAQQAGKEVTPELRAEIDALAQSYVDAAAKTDLIAEGMQRIEENAARGAERLTDMFLSVLDGSKSAKDAIIDLLIEMAKVQAQKALMDAFSGGVFGGLGGAVGGLLGGARAKGGPASAGVPYLVNENTPNSEIFVPSQSGAVLNVPQAQAALKDRGGSAQAAPAVMNVNVQVSGARGNTEIADMVDQGVRRGISQFDRQVLPRRVGQINRDPRKVG
jgi:hypothetical protein